jgi:zinc protease
MAHLLEHMLFKGTPRHRNIPQELTEHGADPNGTTWFDRTNYFETFAATDSNLAWALDLEADRMIHSYVAKKDLETEFTVVRNEFELGENDPGSILEERAMSYRLPLAQLRALDDWGPFRYRAGPHRATAGLLSEVLPA